MDREDFSEVAEEFISYARLALRGRVDRAEEVAYRLGWEESRLLAVLRGQISFESWARICRAVELDPIDALLDGRRAAKREKKRLMAW